MAIIFLSGLKRPTRYSRSETQLAQDTVALGLEVARGSQDSFLDAVDLDGDELNQ